VPRTMSAAVFKARCLQVMDQVAATGESVVVTKRGTPVAQLGPASLMEDQDREESAKAGIVRSEGSSHAWPKRRVLAIQPLGDSPSVWVW
jgi:prevent-host-death family protein